MSILTTIATAAAVTLIPGAGIAFALWRFGKDAVIGFLRSIPPKVWVAIACAALLIGGYFYHGHVVKKAHDAAYTEGAAAEDGKWTKRLNDEHAAALAWKAKAEAQQAAISKEERDRHEQDLRSIASRADDQRVRGPGKAAAPACWRQGDNPGVSSTPGGRVAPAGSGDAAVAGVPSAEPMAIVPWNPLVAFGADHDALLSEVKAWRAWYARQAAASGKGG